ncbi:hypothetical protein EJB05_58013, partial [Eragrostis curvula]
MAYFGGRGRGTWFAAPGADQQRRGGATFPWGRGAGAGEMPSSSTLAQVMASRAPEPWTIRRDAVGAAEAAAREVALRVHPTQEAERRRQDVLGYLKRLFGCTFGFEVRALFHPLPVSLLIPFLRVRLLGCRPVRRSSRRPAAVPRSRSAPARRLVALAIRQKGLFPLPTGRAPRATSVFAFGSVPLKTYLPDGDADVTVLASTWLNSSLIDDVRQVLELEMTNRDAEFQVRGVNFINADVKLLKCIVENIVVDVSFNQIGGVSTFCFLELELLRVKRGLAGRELTGVGDDGVPTVGDECVPTCSKFDWDKYGISLSGPVLLSSLPDITLEPAVALDELLLGQKFLEDSLGRVVISGSNGRDTNFRVKFVNIIDPLKGNNNLGRSVNKASFYRIRSAFSFGAQKLGQILMLPAELIPEEICGFFANTLQQHGKGERPDLGDFSAFESFLGMENAPNEDYLCLKMSCITEDENRGDLDLSLGCLCKVNYHMEYLYDDLKKAIQKAWLAGEINEDFLELLISTRTQTKTRPQRLTIVSSTSTETRKLSPVHSTEDVAHQSHVEDQAGVWHQNVPLSTDGLSFASSPLFNSDNYPVSWLSVSPTSHGTGTYIPRVSREMYRERMERFAPERERRQRPRLADRQLDQCSGLRNDHTEFESTSQVPVKEKGSLQDRHSGKSVDPKGGFLPVWEQTAATRLPKVQISQDVPSSPAIDNSSKDPIEKETLIKPQSSGTEFPHFGQGNPPASSICQPSPATASYCQLKAQTVENLEFGSMGPFSLRLLSAQFEEAFPPLPKKPVTQVPASVVQSPELVVTECRPEEAFQLQDQAEFPPLKAVCR